MTPEQIFRIIKKHKTWLGLGDWKFFLKFDQDIEGVAEIDSDIWEKQATIKFSKRFEKMPKEKQISIIKHELLHGRLNIMQKRIEEISYYIEEDYVNDIERWQQNVK